MAYTTLAPRDHARPYVAGDPWRAGQEAERVADNLDDHETRVLALEAVGTKRATVTLTDAQVKALPTTPITLVAAPGAGLVLVPRRILLMTSFAAAVYTGINAAGSLYATIAGADTTALINDSGATGTPTLVSDLLGSTTKKMGVLFWPWSYDDAAAGSGPIVSVSSLASIANQPLQLKAGNAATPYTGGNGGNTLKAVVEYSVEAVP